MKQISTQSMRILLGKVLILLAIHNTYAQSPGGISSNLHAWWKSDSGVTGSPVTSWTDQSSNSFNLSTSNGPTNLATDINYNPSLSFNGTSNYMQVTGGIFGGSTYSDMFIFIVNKTNTVKNSSIFFEVLNGGDRYGSHITWGNQRVYYDLGTCCGSSRINVNWGSSTGNYHIWSLATSTGTATPSGTRKAIYRDARTIATNNNNDTGTGAGNNFYLGSSNATGSFHSGNVAEVFIYQGVPTATEMQKMHSYLAVKYSLTLTSNDNNNGTAFESPNSRGINEGDYVSSNNSLIWDASSATNYHNNIIGIGRDDNSDLIQKQSHTPDDSVKLYLSSLAASNVLNTGTFSNNNSFLLIGDNTDQMCASVASNAESPLLIHSRIAREWKLTNTNFDGTFSVQLQLNSTADLASITVSDLRLLIDSDGDFSDATIHAAGAGLSFSNSGGNISISGISTSQIPMNSTVYFTLGSVSAATPLPVELISFTAEESNNQDILLKWETASEINNDFFTIEKSIDGTTWEELQNVDGAGNSNSSLKYEEIDYNPFIGLSYYRLKQTDFNGEFSYSDIESVEIKGTTDIVLFPNPSSEIITIKANENTIKEIKIFNLSGSDVTSLLKEVNRSKTKVVFSITELPNGMYLLKTKNGVLKFSKQ